MAWVGQASMQQVRFPRSSPNQIGDGSRVVGSRFRQKVPGSQVAIDLDDGFYRSSLPGVGREDPFRARPGIETSSRWIPPSFFQFFTSNFAPFLDHVIVVDHSKSCRNSIILRIKPSEKVAAGVVVVLRGSTNLQPEEPGQDGHRRRIPFSPSHLPVPAILEPLVEVVGMGRALRGSAIRRSSKPTRPPITDPVSHAGLGREISASLSRFPEAVSSKSSSAVSLFRCAVSRYQGFSFRRSRGDTASFASA